jgi:hypothetical protein
MTDAVGVAHAIDGALGPKLEFATTAKEYSVPFVSPPISQVVSPLVVHVAPPGDATTV